jgi:hypothetical protein
MIYVFRSIRHILVCFPFRYLHVPLKVDHADILMPMSVTVSFSMRPARALEAPNSRVLLIPSQLTVGLGTLRAIRLRTGYRDVTLVLAAVSALLGTADAPPPHQSPPRLQAASDATGSGVSLAAGSSVGDLGGVDDVTSSPTQATSATVESCIANPSSVAIRASIAVSVVEVMLVNDFAGDWFNSHVFVCVRERHAFKPLP